MELLLLLAILSGGYLFSLHVHPLRGCQACKMTGRRGITVFKTSCRRCKGTGEVERWGTRVFFKGTKHTSINSKKK
jgi:DnaJ-class molecular chaperone